MWNSVVTEHHRFNRQRQLYFDISNSYVTTQVYSNTTTTGRQHNGINPTFSAGGNKTK